MAAPSSPSNSPSAPDGTRSEEPPTDDGADADSVDPADPADPADSADSTDPADPADSTDSANSPDSTDSAESVDSADEPDAGDASPVVGDPIDADVDASAHVVVVGYDAWTEPVIAELLDRDVSPTVVTTDETVAARLRERDLPVVASADVDEACFREADVEAADAVLVATLDDQLNVLAVLTAMNVDESAHVVTFAGEEQDVPKLRAAGAERVVSLGQAVGELLVEVALSERRVEEVVRELVGDRS